MKKFLPAGLLLFALIMMHGCKKNENDTDNGNKNKVVPTPVGTPTGTKTSKLIPKSGGSITSADGKLEIFFPSGALSSDQTITIQPITNNCPGGVGLAYRLEPDGSKFNQPVTLKFHYDDSVLKFTLPQCMLIAYQDTRGIWFALDNAKNDTTNHILSGQTLHFSGFTFLENVYLKPESATIKAGESIQLFILVVDVSHFHTILGDVGFALVRGTSSSWAVNGVINGNDQYGKITSNPIVNPLYDYVTYTAPNHAPPKDKNPVQISAEFNQLFMEHNFGYKDSLMDFNKAILYSHIRIIDGGYHVELSFKADSVNEGGALWGLKDKGSFDLVLSGENGSVTNIQNSEISVNLLKNDGSCNVSVSYNGPGNINIVDSSYVIQNPISNSIMIMFNSLDQKNWVKSPIWDYSCPGDDNGQLGGGLGPPFPSAIQFNKADSTQTFDVGGQYKIIVTPIK